MIHSIVKYLTLPRFPRFRMFVAYRYGMLRKFIDAAPGWFRYTSVNQLMVRQIILLILRKGVVWKAWNVKYTPK